ncbi:hypothetical protein JCM6882_006706 [Rhodosporidiobolus microsporus]
MSTTSTPRASLSSLPPELLSSIFLRRRAPNAPSTTYSSAAAAEDDEPLRLPPSCISISRSLLPFTRANAYDHLVLHGDVALAKFGETLAAEGGKNAWIGGLVRKLEVRSESKRFSRYIAQTQNEDTEMRDEWTKERLHAGARAASDALVPGILDEVVIDRASPGELLTSSVLSSRTFSGGADGKKKVKLTIVGDEPVSFEVLRFLGEAKGVGEVEVRGAMRLKTEGAAEEMFLEEIGGVEKVAIESEPHAAGFVPFLEQTNVKSLRLRCSTTDANVVFGGMGPKTKANLEEVDFSTSGYLQRELGLAFSTFPSLTSLALRSPSLLLTDPFFSSLRLLPRLRSLSLLGPVAAGGRPCETLELVADWMESLAVDGRLEELECVRVDVPKTEVVQGLVVEEGKPASRAEFHARRLVAAAERLDITLSGSFLDLLPR